MVTLKGGDKLEQRLAELAARISKPGTLAVGFLENARYPDGKYVAEIAVYQDFGTPNARYPIPPRPFFRNMVAAKSPRWGDALARNLKAQGYDATKALTLMGEGIAGQLRQSIKDTNTPPLSPVTIERKGFAKPLVDTRHMLGSVDFDIK